MSRYFHSLPPIDKILMIGTIAITVALVVDLSSWLMQDRRDPVIFDKVEVLNSPVTPGGHLRVRIYREKIRSDCTVISNRRAISDDGVVYQLGTLNHMGGDANTDWLDYSYPIPTFLPEGSYTLRVSLTYLCPDGPHPVEQPDTRFRVSFF